jgi:DNA-binding NarL/FixJ family response regulator
MTEERRPRVALVDDHPLLRAGLRLALEGAGLHPTEPAMAATDELATAILDGGHDCAIVDLGLPISGGGLGLIKPLATGGVTVAVLTGESDVVLQASCLQAGAAVVLSKAEPLDEIVTVIAQVCRGVAVRASQQAALVAEGHRILEQQRRQLDPFLTLSPREQAVLDALMAGLGPVDIARRDVVSVQTVRTQVKLLLRKLGVRSQLEAAALAQRAGWRPRLPARAR